MNRILTPVILIALAATAQAGIAAEGSDASALVGRNCTSCHDDAVYTRANRRVTTLEGLKNQVRRCELALGLKWFDDDIEAVTSYLNKNYYRFE